MRELQKLQIIRSVHTVIYIVMAVSTLVLLYVGLSGRSGTWLWIALVLVAIESVVFFGNGMKYPLAALAVRYGAITGHVFDTFLPARLTRHTIRFFGTVTAVGLALVVLRGFGALS